MGKTSKPKDDKAIKDALKAMARDIKDFRAQAANANYPRQAAACIKSGEAISDHRKALMKLLK
jgi:hypothetical protein